MIKRTLTTLALFALVSSALADTKSATTQVTLNVLPDCTISATDMDLGIYNSRTGASGTATVRVKCNTDYGVTYSGFSGQLSHTIVPSEKIPYTISYTKNGTPVGALAPLAPLAFGDLVPYSFPGTLTGNGVNQYDDYVLTGAVASGIWDFSGTYKELITFDLNFLLD